MIGLGSKTYRERGKVQFSRGEEAKSVQGTRLVYCLGCYACVGVWQVPVKSGGKLKDCYSFKDGTKKN